MIIRPETPADIPAIFELHQAAFANHPHSRQTESLIVDALRAAGALAVSLVAERDGAVIGHLAFSPVTIPGAANWYGLGPIGVLPAHQRQGIGWFLMQEGLSALRALGANGCVLVGEPAYYERFGFLADPALTVEGVPPQYVLSAGFGANRASGPVTFHPAFAVTR